MDRYIEVLADWNSLDALKTFVDDIERQNTGLSDDQVYLLRLVIEEVATNIIKYGYADLPPGPIQTSCLVSDAGTLKIIIRDRGKSYDPALAPEPDLESEIGNRPLGGLGIFLVREFADAYTYHHDEITGWNESVIVKGRPAHG